MSGDSQSADFSISDLEPLEDIPDVLEAPINLGIELIEF
jgi:hypothetical protein